MTVESSAAEMPRAPPRAPAGNLRPPCLDWVSRLPSASAPGFVYLAGACRGAPVGGGGRDFAEAEARLGGEAAELWAQLSVPVACDTPGDPEIDMSWSDAASPLRVAAVELSGGRSVGVPAAAIFLDPAHAAERAATAPPASLGLAAGPDRDAARLAGLLELVERDAAAGWWIEGQPARQLDAAVGSDLVALRAGATRPRASGFLRLESPLGVPVVCAVSREADNSGLAFGLKAAPHPAAAAAGAVVELLQMELALEMARHRAARGAATDGDRAALERAALAAERFDALAARLPLPERLIATDLDGLVAICARRGLKVIAADLPEVAGLAVTKMFVPGLRPMPWPGARPAPGAPGAAAVLM